MTCRQQSSWITAPNGINSIDDVLNRVQSVHDDDLTVLAEPSDRIGSEMDGGEAGARRVRYGWPSISNQYQYVGLAMAALTTLPEPSVQRRWKKLSGQPSGDAGDPYTGYHRFGRVEQMLWVKTGETPAKLVHIQWGYNRANLETWRKDHLAPASAKQDQHFSYDNLYQITERQQGLLNINHTASGGIPAQQENLTYDETGNWVSYEQRNDGMLDIDQTRENNTSNQITEIDNVSTGVAYDSNGNMLMVPTGGAALDGAPRKLIWDAWNRLRKVMDDADNLLAEYQYGASTQRTISAVGGVARHYYYNDQWRSVEERLDSSADAERQHVWHSADRWELLLRDRSTANNGTLDERLYSMKDQLDPVAICDASGVVQERYACSAIGMTTFLQDDFAPRLVNESDYAWDWLFHGEFADGLTGWFNYGYRYYVVELGRWMSKDPLAVPYDNNAYAFLDNTPFDKIDAFGNKGYSPKELLGKINPASVAITILTQILLRLVSRCQSRNCKEPCLECCSGVGNALIGAAGGLINSLNPIGAIIFAKRFSDAIEKCKSDCDNKPSTSPPDCCEEEE